jgi:transcriptional regulator with XRE-family HTH domain
MTDIREILATNVRRYRKKLGLSQENLADKIDSATGYIGMIERGKQFPSPQMLERIAGALQVDTPDLFAVKPLPITSTKQLYRELLTDFEKMLSAKIERLEIGE